MSPHQTSQRVLSVKFTNWFCFLEASCFHREAKADSTHDLRCFVLPVLTKHLASAPSFQLWENHTESRLSWELLQTQGLTDWDYTRLARVWQEPPQDEDHVILLTNPQVPKPLSSVWFPEACMGYWNTFHLLPQPGGLLHGHTDFCSFKGHANCLLPLHKTTWNCGAGGPFIHALEP